MKQNINKKFGGVGIVLFSLPFAAVGVGALVMMLWTLGEWAAMQTWVEVAATIQSAELETHSSSDSTTYSVRAEYRYQWEGKDYKGNRVAISASSDNIGNFHERVHRELEQYEGTGRKFRCYVNSKNPADSVLYRDLRVELLGFMMIFALAFGGAGFGLMAAGIFGAKINRENEALRLQYPEEPWRWKKEWNSGVIHSHGKAKMIGVLIFAFFWNIISLPVVALGLPGEIMKENYIALLMLIFPAAGAAMIAVAVYFVLQWQRYGDTVFRMASVPGVLGGRLHGTVWIPTVILPEEDVLVALDCIRKITTGSGKNRNTREHILWQSEKGLPRNSLAQENRGTVIPVDFAIPFDQPASDGSDTNNELIWRLRVKAKVPGVDYSASFDVPVFQTGEGDPNMTTAAVNAGVVTTVVDEDGQTITYYETEDAATTGEKIRRAGLRMEPCPGGIAIESPMLRQPGLAIGALLFLVIWGGSIVIMAYLDAPIIFPIVFGLFFILILFFVIDLWVGKNRAEITRSGVRVQNGPFGIGPVRWVSFDAIEGIEMKNTMQSGSQMYYTVFLKKRHGGKQNIVGRLKQQQAQAVIEALQTAIQDYQQ